MKIRTLSCLALMLAACEPAHISAPGARVDTRVSASIQHGDGTPDNPYYYVSPGEWAATYPFAESTPLDEWDAAPCPPMYRGTLWLFIDIPNVGRRRFYFQGPFNWVATISPGYARYTVVVPGVDERGEWTASGPVIAECRRGWIPGLGLIRLTDHEGQLRRNGINAGGDDCNRGGHWGDDPVYMTGYDPYAPAPDEGSVEIACGGGGGGDGYTCYWEWMEIEISYDGGATWQLFWADWGQVCYLHEE